MLLKTISIIIPSCNRPELLENLLQSLGPAIHHCPVFVVQDGSRKEDALEYLQIKDRYRLNLIASSYSRGPAYARNRGAFEANTEWLLFLDDDVICDQDYFVFLKQIEIADDIAGIEGYTKITAGDSNSSGAGVYDYTAGFGSGNLMVRTKYFKELGGFDQNFFCRKQKIHFREDTEFGLRLCQKGRVIFEANLLCTHPLRGKDDFFLLKDARKYWFEAYFLRICPEGREWIGWPWKRGRLKTYQTRGLIADLIVFAFAANCFFHFIWPLIGLYFFLLALFLRHYRLSANLILQTIFYPFIHSAYYWHGAFASRDWKPLIYPFKS